MTTKRRVLLDGNGSTKINVEGLGVYVPAIEHDHLKQKLSAEIQQLKDQRNAMQVDLEIAVKTAETLKNMTAERYKLASEFEEVKALLVDAIGDGWYDGYLACKNDVNNESFDIDTVEDSDVLQWSEHYESEHRYAKSIADIRAEAGRDGFIAGVLLVNPTAKGRESLNDEANKYADSILQAAKAGA